MSGAFWALDLLTLSEIEAIFKSEKKPVEFPTADRESVIGYIRRSASYIPKKV